MLALSFLITILFSSNAIEAFLRGTRTTESLIKDYGYPFENHKVTTEDGYILSLFRIPYSPKNVTNLGEKPVVFLMHGFGQLSSDWVISGSPRSLGFLLADNGYDVWLGNARGTRYSEENTQLSIWNPLFWRFSWHQIGIYDLPANIDYIQRKTGASQVQYVGHSQGTTAFFVATSTVTGFNDRIKSAHLLAPVAFLFNAPAMYLRNFAPLLGQPNRLAAYGDFEFLPNTILTQIFSKIVCTDSSIIRGLCLDLSNFIYGKSDNTNQTALAIFLETVPGGTSSMQLEHFLQLFNSKKFRQFDFGKTKNFALYNQATPPDYVFENITVPLYMYHGKTDILSDPEDVQILANLLRADTLKDLYLVPMDEWNHIDFLLGKDVNNILYERMLRNGL